MYGYVLNNPLKFIDPTGTTCIYNDSDTEHQNPVGDDGDGQGCAGVGVAPGSGPNTITPQQTNVFGGPNAAVQEVEDVVTDFLTGQAPDQVIYGPDDPFVLDFQKSAGMDAIVAGIRRSCSATTGLVPVGSGEAFVNTLIDGILGGSGFRTPEAQLGAFNSTYTRGGGIVNITVTNPISRNSLLYHLPAHVGLKNPKKGPLKTVNQTLHITAPDPCNGRPVG